jgi:CTP-dependent riboflavin kinase
MTQAAEGRKITGVVFSDLGRAGSFMALDRVRESLRKSLGFTPYPGTLNLRLETDEAMEFWREMRERRGIEIVSQDPAHCHARCFLVEIEGKHRGAVVLPEVANYPEDKVEVIAPVRLKDELGVKDGERVTIEFVD